MNRKTQSKCGGFMLPQEGAERRRKQSFAGEMAKAAHQNGWLGGISLAIFWSTLLCSAQATAPGLKSST